MSFIEIQKLEKHIVKLFLKELKQFKQKNILRNDLLLLFNTVAVENNIPEYKETFFFYFLKKVQEILKHDTKFIFSYRFKIGKFRYFATTLKGNIWFEEINAKEFLHISDIVSKS